MSNTQTHRTLGECPKCGGNIIEGKRGYGCSNWREKDGGCRFVIWKIVSGKLIMPQFISKLLEEKEIGPMQGFFSEDEIPFTGVLKLVNENDEWKVRVETSDEEPIEERPRLGECPACGGNVLEGTKAYGCQNWRDKDGGCKFAIWKIIAGKEITPQIASQLITEKKSGPVEGFISRKGEPFSADLKLLEENGEWKVQFDFPNMSEEPIGKCPACGGDIMEKKKAYGCQNWREEDGGCKFAIWKIIAGKEITPQIAKKLITEKKTDSIEGFMSRKGEPFSACLQLVQEDENWKVQFDFPNVSDESIGKCPACGGDILETNKAYGCQNWREADGGCKFAIWKTIAHRELSKETAIQLLEEGKAGPLFGFMSRNGNPFSAKLKLEESEGQYKVVFDFSDDPLPSSGS